MNLGLGDRLDRYIVEGLLGEGGMAVVYKVRHVDLGTAHALKVLLNARPGVVERLLREGRAQGSLRHPNVVAVTDVVRIDGLPGLVMEYVDGANLGEWLQRCRPSVAEIDAIARDVLQGVAAAHRAGIVHRDLKPGNVILERAHGQIRAKVADFGIAKTLVPDPDGFRTRTGIGMGTPAYMAPEQFVDARSVDARADVFALGSLLHELITGRTPYGRADILEIIDSARAGRWVDPSPEFPGVPPRWFEVVRQALRPDRADRPADAEAMLRAWAGDTTRPEPAWSSEAVAAAAPAVMEPRPPGSTLAPAGSGSVDTAFDLVRPRDRRRRWLMAWGGVVLAVALLFLMGVAGGGLWATYFRTHTRVGADIAWVNGLPTVATPLPRAAARARVAWHGMWRGRQLLRLERRTAGGAPGAPWDPRDPNGTPFAFTFVRDASGDLIEQRNARDRVVHQVRVVREGSRVRLVHLDPDGAPRPSPWSEEVVEGHAVAQPAWEEVQTLDRAGRVLERRFLDGAGRPIQAADGAFGVRYRYDVDGQRTRRTTLDADGEPAADRDGVVSYAWTWSGGSPVQVDALGFGELSVVGPDGWASVAWEVDSFGLPLRTTWRGPSGEPIRGPGGCHAEVIRYDGTGESVTYACLDQDGLPTARSTGVHVYRLLFDDRRFPVASLNLDAQGRPFADGNGVYRSERTFDAFGAVVEVGPFLDPEGVAISPANRAFASQRWTWDDLGRLVEVLTLGLSGEPIPGERGVPLVRYRYDAWGNASEVRAFDHQSAPVLDDEGCAITRLTHNRAGGLLEQACLGIDEEPIRGRHGWHRVVFARDDANRVVQEHFEDTDGRWVMHPERGFAGFRQRYDARGMLAEQVHLDETQTPFDGPIGWARCVFAHDHRGLETGMTCFDAQGARTAVSDGISRVEYVYDPYRRLVETRSFDVDDRPTTSFCAVVTTAYDLRGNRLVVRCLDAAGRLMAGSGRVAEDRYAYDALGRLISRSRHGVDGELAAGERGWARVAYEYDAAGNVVHTAYFDADGAPAAINEAGLSSWRDTYDGVGRHVAQRMFDRRGEPLAGEVYAAWEQDFDVHGRVVEERYLGADGGPATRHPAVQRNTHDPLGRLVRVERLVADGTPSRNGWAVHLRSWAQDGGVASDSYLDADGAPTPGPEGCARVRYVVGDGGVRAPRCDDAL